MIRILCGMAEAGAPGGVNACEPPFVAALEKLTDDVSVATETYVRIPPRGAAVVTRARRVLQTARRLRRRLKREKFDVLHLNTSFDARAVWRDYVTLKMLRRVRNRPAVFLKMHGSEPTLLTENGKFVWRRAWKLIEMADGIGVLSSEERATLIAAGVAAHKLFVVKNAVAPARPVESAAEFRARLGIAPETPILLFIARFIPTKGLQDTLRAAALLQADGVEFTLCCVGDGSERRAAEQFARAAGLKPPRVIFTGRIPEMETAAYYRYSSALVFPTFHIEGFPMTVFNALACGLPIVTTEIRAAADYLREPENCLWVPAQNPEQLARILRRLLRDAPLRARMAENNRQLAKEFTPDKIAREYLEIYRQLSPER